MGKKKWIVSMEDGSTIMEGQSGFDIIPDQPLPFHRLEKDKIRSLRLQGDGITITLPSKSSKAKFPSSPPNTFRVEYQLNYNISKNSAEHFTIGVAEYDDFIVRVIWQDEGGSDIWVQIIKKEEVK
jgi:hypothetical protein